MNARAVHIARFGKPGWLIDQEREQEARRNNPMSVLVNTYAQADPDVDHLLGPTGPIAQTLPHYRPRSGQIQLAQAMANAVRLRKQLLGEAGTGIGKSLAYLVVAILHSLKTGGKVVVSTANLALQDQLRNKDLPFLQETLGDWLTERYGRNFRWAVHKGKGNFVCEAKLNAQEIPLDLADAAEDVDTWLAETTTGDIGELTLDLKSERYWPLKVAYTAEGSEDCPGASKCPYGDTCWYYRSLHRAMEADVLVVNHALVVINRVLGDQLLPPHDLLILDEAHQLEEYVRSGTERTLSATRTLKLLRKAGAEKELRAQVDTFFGQLQDQVIHRLGGDRAGQIHLPPRELPPALLESRDVLEEGLRELQGRLEVDARLNEGTQEGGKPLALARAVGDLRGDLRALETSEQAVLWAEVHQVGKAATYRLTLVDVSTWCKQNLWIKPALLTSATLTTSRNPDSAFAYQKATLGLANPLEIAVESPYNYRRQALYYLPAIPESAIERRPRENHRDSSRRYALALAPHIRACLEATQGRAFVLFTSYGVLREVRELLGELPWPSLCQGDASKSAILSWFRTTPNPVLFATSSFWEGVDVAGEQLSCVIIDKIPVPNPTHPVMAARLEATGKEGFFKISVPKAKMALDQAVGRLIRRETDRGLIVLCDPRFQTKGYAKTLLRGLPGSPEAGVSTLAPESLAVVPTFLANAPRQAQGDQEAWARQALLALADLDPDRAGARNDVGFNGADTEFGHSLVEQVLRGGLSSRQWGLAVQMCRKYHRQIGACPGLETQEEVA